MSTAVAPSPAQRLVRLPDWPMRLDALVFGRLMTPFAWGNNDCALFAADCVLAMTGVDLAAGLRSLGARAAMRLLQRHGGMVQLIPEALRPLPRVADATEGDIALLPADRRGRMALAVCTRGDRVLAPGRAGLMIAPRTGAVRAWRVG